MLPVRFEPTISAGERPKSHKYLKDLNERMEKRNIFNRERRRNWLDLKSGVLANTVG
jgi:hypothetical protein